MTREPRKEPHIAEFNPDGNLRQLHEALLSRPRGVPPFWLVPEAVVFRFPGERLGGSCDACAAGRP